MPVLQDWIEYLGHIVSIEGDKPNSKNVQAMIDWSISKNLK